MDTRPPAPPASPRHERAIARWDDEGGAAGPAPPAAAPIPAEIAELAQLRVRVVALENLVISLLAESSVRQLELARAMATYISPRPGFTPHRVTLNAASQMLHLARRAGHFRSTTPD